MRAIAAFLAILSLAGCVSSQERAAALAAKDDASCRSLGAEPKTGPYVACRLKLEEMRRADSNAAAVAGAILQSTP